MYERAITADPNNDNNLGNYASFLHYVRRDLYRAKAMYERAIKMCDRAIEADPSHGQ